MLNCFEVEDKQVGAYKSLTQLLGAGRMALFNGKPGHSEKVQEEDGDEGSAQFGAVIDFPNFLLQVLSMVPGSDFTDVPLDDKQLLTAFEPLLRGDAALVQDFAFRLLRCRFLLDQCVIKSSLDSQDEEEHWQLQRCRFRNEQAALQWVNAFEDGGHDLSERLRMLQAAMQVSFMLPTRKHWLQGALRWLSRQKITQPIDPEAFLLALEELAKAFVLEVGASAGWPVSYDEVVRREVRFFTAQTQDSDLVQALPGKLVYGRARLIDFNFLDYLLWLAAQGQATAQANEWRDFAFTSSRRSVEHLHPQTELFKGNTWDNSDHLHAFGNLCLVSHAMNSRLGNSGPEDKFRQLIQVGKSVSLKAVHMHRCFDEEKSWLPDRSMAVHAAGMLALLVQAFATSDLLDFRAAKGAREGSDAVSSSAGTRRRENGGFKESRYA